MAAFAGESEARNKYTYFASKAKKVFCGVANAVQFFEPQLGVFLLIISSFEEECLIR